MGSENNRAASPAAHRKSFGNTFEGTIVRTTTDKVVMANPQGKEFAHALAGDAKITCDGADCKAEQLKAGNKVRVTTRPDDRSVATCVETLDKNSGFERCD